MENKEIATRPAQERDADVICEITKEAFSQYVKNAGIPETIDALHETPDDVLRDIQTKLVTVAEIDGVIIGSVRVELLGGGNAYLSRFGVKSEYQKLGAGRILMAAVDKQMPMYDVKKLALHTASRLKSLVRFYYAHDFYIQSVEDKGYLRAYFVKEYM